MKSIKESIQLNEGVLRGRLTGNDKKNYALIADAISNITTEISNWMEMSEENEDSDTAALAHSLSNLAAQLRGEWDESVEFNYHK